MHRGEGRATVGVQELILNASPDELRMQMPGAITAKLLKAGSSFLLPDLIQNIADRPDDEVRDFFDRLIALPARPSMEALAEVFGWYEDGFLEGLPYERDPVAAWAECAPPAPPSTLRKLHRCLLHESLLASTSLVCTIFY